MADRFRMARGVSISAQIRHRPWAVSMIRATRSTSRAVSTLGTSNTSGHSRDSASASRSFRPSTVQGAFTRTPSVGLPSPALSPRPTKSSTSARAASLPTSGTESSRSSRATSAPDVIDASKRAGVAPGVTNQVQ